MADKDLRVNLKADDEITPAARKAKASLDAIPDTVSTKVTADVDSSGLDDLTSKLGDLPGSLGDVAGLLTGGAGIAAGVGAAAAAAYDLAQGFAEAAVQARVTADLTGATIEDASRLQAVWKQSGADLNDLNDVLLQMNGVLQTSPEYAAQIGVNLDDGRDVASRFVEVVGKIQNSTLDASDKAQLMSQMFGEEGVRQVAKLTASIDGPLSDAIDDVSEAQIIDEDEEQRAKDLAVQTRKLNTEWQNLKMTMGEALVGPLAEEMGRKLAEWEAIKGVFSGDFWGSVFDVDGPTRLTAALDPAVDNLKNYREQVAAAAAAAADAVGSTVDWGGVIGDAGEGAAEAARNVAALNEATLAGVDAIAAHQAALEGMADARRASVDSTFAARDADRDYIDQLIETETQLAEHPELVRENAAALDDLALAAGKNADAQAQLAVDQAAARGAALSAADAEKVRTASLVNSARTTSGPMHDAIVNYIAALNGIPPEKVSEILADPNYATIDAAAAALNRAAVDRDADITAQALNVPPVAYALDQAARPRTAVITAQLQGQRNLVLPPSVSGAAMPMTATATGPATYAAPVGYTTVPTVTRATVPAPTVTFNVGVMGNRFDSQRAVTKALRAHQRLNGVRP